MRGSNRVLPHRRKREGRTDYRLRLKLLKSRQPRLVVRRSLSNITCQVVVYEPKGDKVVVTADSKELREFGWKFHCGNIPAAYLTGFLCAERAKKHKISNAILDIGLYQAIHGGQLYSALKGAVDGGLDISHSDDVLPPQERFSGQHIAAYSEKLKADEPDKYKKVFSACLREKADPKEMPAVFEETKKKIAAEKGERKKAHHEPGKEHKAEHAHKEHKAETHEHKAEHPQEHKTEHKAEHHEHKAEHAEAKHDHAAEHHEHKKG